MTLASTPNQLVRLAYGELPLLERLETEYAVDTDPDLRAEYGELQAAVAELPRVRFSPSALAVSAILAYSRNAEA